MEGRSRGHRVHEPATRPGEPGGAPPPVPDLAGAASGILSLTPHPILLFDPDGRVVFQNPAAQALVEGPATPYDPGPDGFAAAGLTGPDVSDAIDHAIGGPATVRISSQTTAADPPRSFDWLFSRLPDAVDGTPLVAGFCQETTERRRMEADVRRAQEQAEDLIRHAPTGIYEIDFSGPRFLEVNDAMCALSGYGREELLAMNPMAVLLPESQQVFRQRMLESLAGRPPSDEVEYQVRRKDGSVIFVELKVRFNVGPDGRAGTALVIGHDVTERIAAARERERLLASETASRREAKRELERLRMMLEAERAVAREPTLDDVLVVLCRVLIDATAHRRVTVSLWDEERGVFVLAASGGVLPAAQGRAYRPDELADEVNDVVESRRAAVIDLDAAAHRRRTKRRTSAHSALLVPLVYRDRVVGLLAIDDAEEQRPFSQRDVDLAEGVAAQAAAAIENARLLRAERQAREHERVRSEHLALLRDLAEIGASREGRAAMAERQLAVLQQQFALAGAFIFLADGGASALAAHACVGAPIHEFRSTAPIPLQSEAANAGVYRSGEPIFIPDVSADVETPVEVREYLRAGTARAVAILPLSAGSQVIGTLDMVFGDHIDASGDEQVFMRSLATEIALGLQNAGLLESERARRHRIETLHGVVDASVSTLDVHQSARQMLHYLSRRTGCSSCRLMLAARGVLEVIAFTGPAPSAGFDPLPISSQLEAPTVYRTGRSTVVTDLGAAGDEVRALHEQVGAGGDSYVLVPLKSRGSTIGVLSMSWAEPRQIASDDVEFYESLAAELGVVLENARLYEVEHDIADRLQEALLSIPGHMTGLDFAHAYRSATEATRVGGDFYDLFELDADRVGIVIGDVAGKGLDAAVLTSVVKNTIHAHAHEPARTPAHTLEITNQIVFQSTPVEAFATVFYGVLDRRDGRLQFANAGHTTSALVFADGRTARLLTTGPLLGAFPSARFVGAEARVGIGDTLFLYTDGLTEVRREGELFGEERLFARLAESAMETPTDMVLGAVGDAISFSSGMLKDDVAVLAVRRVDAGPGMDEQLTLPL